MNVQTGFNQYKAVTFMQSYISKSEDEYSLSMRQEATAFEEKLDYLPMRKIVRLCTNNRERSLQENVYHILHLPKTFPGVSFINNNLPGGIHVSILLY